MAKQINTAYGPIKFDGSQYKTSGGAAMALYAAICELAESIGQKPELEVDIWPPAHSGENCWRVSWEAGPFQWAIPASFEITGPFGYTEPYYSFDLCFTNQVSQNSLKREDMT
jgi:hypothetical protein